MNEYSRKMIRVPTINLLREQDMGKQPVLDVRNLGIDFGGLTAVDSFNITIGPTEISGLIGPNGAGKTTIFNLLTGVYQPTNGRVEFMGETMICNHPTGKMKKNYLGKNGDKFVSSRNIDPTPDFVVQKGISRTFQNIRLWNGWPWQDRES